MNFGTPQHVAGPVAGRLQVLIVRTGQESAGHLPRRMHHSECVRPSLPINGLPWPCWRSALIHRLRVEQRERCGSSASLVTDLNKQDDETNP